MSASPTNATGDLAFDRVGAGEPLVLLHGISHGRQAWSPVVETLAADFDVIVPDLPGHGDSPDAGFDANPLAADADALVAFFASHGIERPHIVGNSLGGQIALELASRGQARSVTALSPGGFWFSAIDYLYTVVLFTTVMVIATLLKPIAPWLLTKRFGKSFMFFWVCAQPTKLSSERCLADYQGLMRARKSVMRYAFTARAFRQKAPEGIPLTIAWADRDMVLPPYQARTARRRLPSARHLRLARCGHVPMSDNPELVAEIIKSGTQARS